jgi:hypothetical protein
LYRREIVYGCQFGSSLCAGGGGGETEGKETVPCGAPSIIYEVDDGACVTDTCIDPEAVLEGEVVARGEVVVTGIAASAIAGGVATKAGSVEIGAAGIAAVTTGTAAAISFK